MKSLLEGLENKRKSQKVGNRLEDQKRERQKKDKIRGQSGGSNSWIIVVLEIKGKNIEEEELITIFKEHSPEPEDTCSQNARAIECPAWWQDEDSHQDILAQNVSTGLRVKF